MTQGKLLDFLADLGISISAGYLSNLLIKNHSGFETEKKEIYDSGLASSPWQHFDQIVRPDSVNLKSQISNLKLYDLDSATHSHSG